LPKQFPDKVKGLPPRSFPTPRNDTDDNEFSFKHYLENPVIAFQTRLLLILVHKAIFVRWNILGNITHFALGHIGVSSKVDLFFSLELMQSSAAAS
jgi:hypothetical protein